VSTRAPADSHSTVTVDVVVAPRTTHTGHPHHPSHLPFSGAYVDALTAGALSALVAGAALLAASRRRARPNAPPHPRSTP
jgi:hypothetical protein